MEKRQDLRVMNNTPRSGLSRRVAVQRLFAGAGAAFAIPGVAAAHPIHKHLADATVLQQAEVSSAGKEWSPAFLDAHQNETLIVLAELIVPGSTRAQVNRFIDLLLSVDTQDNQKEFVAALSAFEAEALNRYSHPFKALSEEQQVKILTDASTAGIEAREAPEQPLKSHFENLKGWISGAYYSSEIGMRELGWTGNYFFESFPGCQHPEGHH
jgi:Gluconate 2-dehydrogenase subunit 3